MTVEIISGNYTASSPSVSATAACYLTKKVLRYNKGAYDDDYEGVYLGTDGIGLGAGAFYVDSNGTLSLHSSNFMIGSETSNGTTTTYLRFNNNGDEETTYIDDVHITTPTVECGSVISSSAQFTNLASTTSNLGDIIVSESTISSGGTSFVMNNGGAAKSFTVQLSLSRVESTSKYTITMSTTDGTAVYNSVGYVVEYTYGFTGGKTAQVLVTISANNSSGSTTVDGGIWQAWDVYFFDGTREKTFTQTNGNSIAVMGSLLPNSTSTSYTVGSSTYPWSAVYSQSVITPSIGSSTGSVAVSGNLMPSIASNSYTVGSASYPWSAVYANTFYGTIDGDSSDQKLKENICDLPLELSEKLIKLLVPRLYKFKEPEDSRPRYGFIAQEVENILPELGITIYDTSIVSKTNLDEPDSDTNLYTLSYKDIIAPIVKVVQCLLERVENLEILNNTSKN